MKLLKKEDYPAWLKAADVENETVYIDKYGDIYWMNGTWKDGTWKGGTWKDGTWLDGIWETGIWKGGTWESGIWKGGYWHNGTWKGGTWQYGTWKGGLWESGIWQYGIWQYGLWKGGTWQYGIWKGGTWQYGYWHNGIWHNGIWESGLWQGGAWQDGYWLSGTWQYGIWKGGTWQDPVIKDRMLYMCGLIGIIFDENGYAKAYRTTNADHTGRHDNYYIQKEGYFEEPNAAPAGYGTCCSGIHVTSMSTAVSYFGIDTTAVLWEVTFKREDLLDCDGQKARIRAGTAKIIKCPFM